MRKTKNVSGPHEISGRKGKLGQAGQLELLERWRLDPGSSLAKMSSYIALSSKTRRDAQAILSKTNEGFCEGDIIRLSSSLQWLLTNRNFSPLELTGPLTRIAKRTGCNDAVFAVIECVLAKGDREAVPSALLHYFDNNVRSASRGCSGAVLSASMRMDAERIKNARGLVISNDGVETID
jgi:hypothetical protein